MSQPTHTAPTPCREWTGHRNRDGYGTRTFEGKTQLAHRVALAQHLGRPIKPGHQALHACDNPGCVSTDPGHVYEGTQQRNMDDMVARGRARNAHAGKTHCVNDHEFTEANTYVRGDGSRDCRRCHADKTARARTGAVAS